MSDSKIRIFTVPNIVTCLNLLSGCVGIVFALKGNLHVAMACVLLSAVFDFFDGFAARLLHSYSAIGVQLDSLADMVSFGTLPAVMLLSTLSQTDLFMQVSSDALRYAIAFSPFLLTVFSALRLAKFNVDDRQTESFLGLPTPSNALFFSSLAASGLVLQLSAWVTLALIPVFCYLLIGEIPMFSLKIKNFSVKKYAYQLVLVALSVVALVVALALGVPLAAFSIIILIYIILSISKLLFKGIK